MNDTSPSVETLELKAKLLGSLLTFTKMFYKLRTGRDFRISYPVGRESHFITVCRNLVKVQRGEINRLIINIPPRYGKTELLIHFVAWSLAQYPDSNFLYVSYSHTLAKKQTQTIREIINLPYYRKLFDIRIADNSSAKDDFELESGGSVYAAGAGGTITGRGAGIMGCNRFGGCIVIDDIHKPDEATSDVIREGIIDWYYNTMQSRLNDGVRTPIVFIGQRVHEYDLPSHLLSSENNWDKLIIPALDVVKNALYPELHSKQDLLDMQQKEAYVFASQYQQNPTPAGGGIWKEEDFLLLDETPHIIATFITADTAETDKDYNDKTVFSFWGVYKIVQQNIESEMYGLYWIDCVELSIEPRDLKNEFLAFYAGCMQYQIKPNLAAIEKKSTGVTLVSILKDMQGLQILEIERTKASGSKASRYLEIQPYIASKRITLSRYGKHVKMCLDHCKKITANNTHRFDDIADTLYDAVKIALIDKLILTMSIPEAKESETKIIDAFVDKLGKLNKRAY